MLRKPTYLLLLLAVLLCSHDMYLKMDTFFLEPNQQATLSLYNGTFDKSEAILTRERMRDASMVAQGERKAITQDRWTYRDSTLTQLRFNTGEAGTYVIGVSRETSQLAMEADRFNSYLEHDGVLGMLEQRRKNNTLDQDSKEQYAKHGKAIYQVGDAKTDDWKTVLGYPIEFVPLENPYDNYTGDTLPVQLLLDGKPLADQFVYAEHVPSSGHTHDGSTHDHDHSTEDHAHDGTASDHNHDNNSAGDHTHASGQQMKTDQNGVVNVELPEDGVYYLRTINMVTVDDDSDLTHESKWATLTFEVTHKHGSDTHTHEDSDHSHDDGFPTWVFIVGSLVLIGILFLLFRKTGS